MTAALICYALVLLVRHLPQTILDYRNRRARILAATHTHARAYHLVIIWCTLHTFAFIRMAGGSTTHEGVVPVGLSIVAFGCAFGLWALFSLSAHSAYHMGLVILEESHLVRERAYAVVRHPLRLALAAETLGALLISGNAYLVILWASLVLAQVIRSRDEDLLLRSRYGEELSCYKRQVPAVNLAAGIWRLLRRRHRQPDCENAYADPTP